MRNGSRSHTAQYVALVRAILSHQGVIDDAYAAPMLTLGMRAAKAALLVPPLRSATNSVFFAALAARITFFDNEVTSALDAGIRQIVIVGAGYDSRAWRFSRPEVRFFEVDHPATQRDKQRRAPVDGPTYVAVDLAVDSLSDALDAAGYDALVPALFVVEGVTMYFNRAGCASLLSALAETAPSGSRLAVNFAAPPDVGTATDRRRQRALQFLGRAGGEPHLSFMRASEVEPFVATTPWKVGRMTTLREIGLTLLHGTRLRVDGINHEAAVVSGLIR